jgi:hypothetical protein
LDTNGLDTGGVRFRQEANNVITDNSIAYAYSPGIFQPYNIAGRHGSTFINGAADGTVGTVITTPVDFPDLSSTNFQIGYKYMGNIGKLRVWAADIGDDGIEEASA